MIRCVNCESADCSKLIEKSSYALFKCNKCGSIFKYIQDFSLTKRQALQDSVYTPMTLYNRINNPIFRKIANERLQFLKKYIKNGKLLEIGCATGEFLLEAKKTGFDVEGLDASPIFVKYLKRKGIPAKLGTFENTDFEEKSFDAIVAFHLIEHIYAPNEFLKKAYTVLKKKGILFLITPNVDQGIDKIFGWEHPTYTEPDHLCFYSPTVIQNILKRNRFQTIRIVSHEPLYHIFTSTGIFLKGRKSSFLRLVSRLIRPYLLARIFTPLLNRYASSLEKELRGHEIFVISEKDQH